MNWKKFQYVLRGLIRRGYQKRRCPSCGAEIAQRVDRKGFHDLLHCGGCKLLYRWPYETQVEVARYYQSGYQQPGLTTDLPDSSKLDSLLASRFQGTGKDFSRVVKLLEVLSVPTGARILDFGANWGYGVWQFCQAGYTAVGYELSRPRAEFSHRLGVDVFCHWREVEKNGPFDIVFSSHVLEHTPDPAEAMRKQLRVLASGGLLIAVVPNGSDDFRNASPQAFHKLWGWSHPVMLNDRFVSSVLPHVYTAIGSFAGPDLNALVGWDRQSHWRGMLLDDEMLFVAVKKSPP